MVTDGNNTKSKIYNNVVMKLGTRFCMMNPKNCTAYFDKYKLDVNCDRCGFNLNEYNRRIADIRQNGLERVGKDRFGMYIRGYIVKKPKNGGETKRV